MEANETRDRGGDVQLLSALADGNRGELIAKTSVDGDFGVMRQVSLT